LFPTSTRLGSGRAGKHQAPGAESAQIQPAGLQVQKVGAKARGHLLRLLLIHGGSKLSKGAVWCNQGCTPVAIRMIRKVFYLVKAVTHRLRCSKEHGSKHKRGSELEGAI